MPTADTPGYLRRMRAMPAIQKKAEGLRGIKSFAALTSQQIDDLVEIIVAFVTEPADKTEAEQLVLDASSSDLLEMLNAALGLFAPMA